MLAEELKQRAHKLEKIKKDAEELAAKLEGVSLKIATKVSATGTIFGSVGNIQIADELAKLGHNIEEARADLFGLYYVADPKLVELGLTPSADAYTFSL